MSQSKEKIFEEGKKRWALTGTEKEFYQWLIKAMSLVTKTINGSPVTTETEGEDMTITSGSGNSYFPSGW